MDTRKELKRYIDENGIMQKHIAKKIGITPAMLSMYLKGKRNLSEDNMQNLQNYLNSKVI